MLRLTPTFLCSCIAACSAMPDTPAPPVTRTVLLQYAGLPTVSDSLAVSTIGGAPALVYPIIHSITVLTSASTSAFAALNRRPEVDAVDSIDQACGGFSMLILTKREPTTADSLALVSIGAKSVDLTSERPDHILGNFDRTKLGPVVSVADRLTDDSNIVTADLELGCLTLTRRSP